MLGGLRAHTHTCASKFPVFKKSARWWVQSGMQGLFEA